MEPRSVRSHMTRASLALSVERKAAEPPALTIISRVGSRSLTANPCPPALCGEGLAYSGPPNFRGPDALSGNDSNAPLEACAELAVQHTQSATLPQPRLEPSANSWSSGSRA